jgi:hypothetical protein
MEELVLFLPADKAKKGVIHMSKKEKGTFTINECYLMMFSEYEDIVTANEVAQMMRLPVKRVYRMFRSGELKSFKGEREVKPASCGLLSTYSNTVYPSRELSQAAKGSRHCVLSGAQEPQADSGVSGPRRQAFLHGVSIAASG